MRKDSTVPPRIMIGALLAVVAACATPPPPEPQPEAVPADQPRSGLDWVTVVALGLE